MQSPVNKDGIWVMAWTALAAFAGWSGYTKLHSETALGVLILSAAAVFLLNAVKHFKLARRAK